MNNGEPTDLVAVNEIFQNISGKILAEMTQVLQENGIEGYSVYSFTIGEPPKTNPDICIPSLHRVHDQVFELKCTYVTVFE